MTKKVLFNLGSPYRNLTIYISDQFAAPKKRLGKRCSKNKTKIMERQEVIFFINNVRNTVSAVTSVWVNS